MGDIPHSVPEGRCNCQWLFSTDNQRKDLAVLSNVEFQQFTSSKQAQRWIERTIRETDEAINAEGNRA